MGNIEKSAQLSGSQILGILASEKRGESFLIAKATFSDVPKIAALINDEAKKSGAVLPVTPEEVSSWIAKGLSFVAKTYDGKIIGHQSLQEWPESGWFEFRAGIVLQDYRGNGINMDMKSEAMGTILKEHPGATIVGLKNGSSSGKNILYGLGFKELPKSQVPGELFSIGPESEEYCVYAYNAPSFDHVHDLARV